MFDLLKQPYPFENGFGRAVRRAAIIGLFVGGFLLIFQPFGLNLWQTAHKTEKLLGFGLISFLITIANFFSWPRLFPRQFTEDSWTVGREILLILVNVLLITIANRVYLDLLLSGEDDATSGWLNMLIMTTLIGIFPVSAIVILNYIRQLKKYSQSAGELLGKVTAEEMAKPFVKVPETITLTLVAENGKDTLSLLADELLYIESSDNYCTVVYLKNGQPTKPLLRSSLSRMENQINQPHIVRCHRSYVVNLNRVERVTGNAQGYKLHLLDGQFQIPVARQYNDTLVAELKAL